MIKSSEIMARKNGFSWDRKKRKQKNRALGERQLNQNLRGSHCLNKEMIFHAVGK